MRSMRKLKLLITVVILAALPLHAQDSAPSWNQWRGPSRDGRVPPAFVPAAWPASFEPAWRVELGEGFSSPVLAGGRLFVHSRKDPQEVVTAIEAGGGRVLWQQSYDAPYEKNQYAVKMAKGPNATPLVVA